MSGDLFTSSFSISGNIYYRTLIPYADFSHLSVNSTTGNIFCIASFVRTNFGTYVYSFDNQGNVTWIQKLSEKTTIDGTSVGLNKYAY